MTGRGEDVPLFVMRLDIPRRITSAHGVQVVAATGDGICRGSAVATSRSEKALVLSEFTMGAAGSGPARTCGVPRSMRLEAGPDGSMAWVEGSTSTDVEYVEPGAVQVPAVMRGVWQDGNGLRITFGEGGLGLVSVTGELVAGARTCRWEAALLSYEDGVLRTTGAQPVARAPKCQASRGTYDYQLVDRDPNVLVRSSFSESLTTTLHRMR